MARYGDMPLEEAAEKFPIGSIVYRDFTDAQRMGTNYGQVIPAEEYMKQQMVDYSYRGSAFVGRIGKTLIAIRWFDRGESIGSAYPERIRIPPRLSEVEHG